MLLVEAGGERLVEAAMFGFGEPISAEGDFGEALRDGAGRGDGAEQEGEDEEGAHGRLHRGEASVAEMGRADSAVRPTVA